MAPLDRESNRHREQEHNTLARQPFVSIQQAPFGATPERTTPEAIVQLVRDRGSSEDYQWIRNTQLHEDGDHDQGNKAAPARLRPALRLTINPGTLTVQNLQIDVCVQPSNSRRVPQLYRALPR